MTSNCLHDSTPAYGMLSIVVTTVYHFSAVYLYCRLKTSAMVTFLSYFLILWQSCMGHLLHWYDAGCCNKAGHFEPSKLFVFFYDHGTGGLN